MMTFELFQQISRPLFARIMDFFYEKDKEALKAAVQTMAVNRKLRPIFIQRKPKDERFRWLQKEMAKKYNQTVGENLLQTWFMQARSEMLIAFLDELGIEHNEQGEVKEMPEKVTDAKLKKGVDTLLEKFDREEVTLYLEAILAMEMAGWPNLRKTLDTDERLWLGDGPAPEKKKPAATETQSKEDAPAAAKEVEEKTEKPAAPAKKETSAPKEKTPADKKEGAPKSTAPAAAKKKPASAASSPSSAEKSKTKAASAPSSKKPEEPEDEPKTKAGPAKKSTAAGAAGAKKPAAAKSTKSTSAEAEKKSSTAKSSGPAAGKKTAGSSASKSTKAPAKKSTSTAAGKKKSGE